MAKAQAMAAGGVGGKTQLVLAFSTSPWWRLGEFWRDFEGVFRLCQDERECVEVRGSHMVTFTFFWHAGSCWLGWSCVMYDNSYCKLCISIKKLLSTKKNSSLVWWLIVEPSGHDAHQQLLFKLWSVVRTRQKQHYQIVILSTLCLLFSDPKLSCPLPTQIMIFNHTAWTVKFIDGFLCIEIRNWLS